MYQRYLLLALSVLLMNTHPAAAFSENGVSWSPDSQQIIFHSNKNGGSQIFLADINQKNLWRQLTTNGFNRYPSWSPDGKKIIYMGWGENDKGFTSYIMNADGSDSKRVSEQEQTQFGGQISPDGQRIAYCVPDGTKPQIWLMNIDGSKPHPLTEGCWPKWSPKGDALVFGATHPQTKDFDIVLYNLANKHSQFLTAEKGNDWAALFSNDGKRIYFGSQRNSDYTSMFDGKWQLYSMNLDGSQVTPEQPAIAFDAVTGFSPDGRWLAYASSAYGDHEIMLKDLQTQQIKNFTQTSISNRNGSLSHDGKWLAFESLRDGNREIYLQSTENARLINISQSTSDDKSPVWSPNSNRLYFTSNRADSEGKNYQLFEYSHHQLKQLTQLSGDIDSASISRDGQIAYINLVTVKGAEIHTLDITSKTTKRLLASQPKQFLPLIDPNQSRLGLTREVNGKYTALLYDIASKKEQTIGEPGADTIITDWSNDGTKLLLASSKDGNFDVYLFTIKTAEYQRITNSKATDMNPKFNGTNDKITFESRRDGNWDLYQYDLASHSVALAVTD